MSTWVAEDRNDSKRALARFGKFNSTASGIEVIKCDCCERHLKPCYDWSTSTVRRNVLVDSANYHQLGVFILASVKSLQRNISTNIWSWEKRTGLKLADVSYLFIFYNITISYWAFSLNDIRFILFYCVTARKRSIKKTPISPFGS